MKTKRLFYRFQQLIILVLHLVLLKWMHFSLTESGRLDFQEVPASIGQTFGAAQAAIVLPTIEIKELSNGYLKLSKFLIEKGNIIQPVLKNKKDHLSSNLSLWVFGKNNELGQSLLPILKTNGIDIIVHFIQIIKPREPE